MIDCNPFSYACDGGWPDEIMEEWLIPDLVKQTDGYEYPYVGVGGVCDQSVERLDIIMESMTTIPRYDA